ncbi:MAG TPA: B12-binding domain-containing radical SAM protein, partial [Solibacterales bacterium]|nr:B12-binding domain-containing radical SAM protein [Bryobacterales bacterium]
RGIRIPFECITRADRVNERVAATLQELGCTRVWIGSESGSQRVLDAMQRGVTVEQVRRAVALCKENGIQTGMFLMWGYDGEDISDIEATIGHVRECRPDIFLTTVSYPIRGTPYFDKVATRLVNIQPWERSTDREYRIQGRHSRRFYQYADELLRTEMCAEPQQQAILAAREGLHATYAETEA